MNDDTFTYQELRITLTAFAIWAGLADSGSSKAVEVVDRFIAETTQDPESDIRLKLVDP